MAIGFVVTTILFVILVLALLAKHRSMDAYEFYLATLGLFIVLYLLAQLDTNEKKSVENFYQDEETSDNTNNNQESTTTEEEGTQEETTQEETIQEETIEEEGPITASNFYQRFKSLPTLVKNIITVDMDYAIAKITGKDEENDNEGEPFTVEKDYYIKNPDPLLIDAKTNKISDEKFKKRVKEIEDINHMLVLLRKGKKPVYDKVVSQFSSNTI